MPAAPAKAEKAVKQAPAAIMPAPPVPEPVPAPETNIFPDANVGSVWLFADLCFFQLN